MDLDELEPANFSSENAPVARALRRGYAKLPGGQIGAGTFPPLFPPFLSPLSPFHGEDFPPASAPFGMTQIARMKHEWNKWNEWNTKERRMKQMKHEWNTRPRLACPGISAVCLSCVSAAARLGVAARFDFASIVVFFPLHLVRKNAQDWPQWPRMAAASVVLCEVWKRRPSARTRSEAWLQMVSTRGCNQNLSSPQELRASRCVWQTSYLPLRISCESNVHSIT